ncbi:MAG TPA: glycosyltransferase [Coleofasciculaceae cyanobacterium]
MTTSTPPKLLSKLSIYFNWLMMLGISALGFTGLKLLSNPDQLAILGLTSLMVVGTMGTWRWGWFAFALVRSLIYRHLVFVRWRRRANAISVEELPRLCLIAPTFKEKPWITERVFRAIAQEAMTLTQPIILVIVTTEAEIVAITEILKSVDPDLNSVHLISLADPGGGKRKALVAGLRKLASLDLPKDTIVGLMDGDSVVSSGTFRKCLPFFRMFPKMGALTTDEMPIVVGSYLFSEWLHLRFCQRHLYMCSHSLSRKLLCLTGRFSLYRAEAALDPSFADLLENDNLDDWLWGRFKFLSGDDKSTWYWLLRRKYDLLYMPDVMVYTIETISGSFAERAYQNMRRWFGNMLRNGNRAIALGPHRTGWFIWYCLLDQRISIWTSLIAPSLLLMYLLQGKWTAVGIISSWIAFSRPLMLMIVFCGRESHLKPIHLLILLLAQWSSSAIKVWTQMNLPKQKWSNRGNQSRSVEGLAWKRRLKDHTSRFLLITQSFSFVVCILCLSKVVNPVQDLAGLWWSNQVVAQPTATQIVEASNHNIVPNDNRDDSASLQALINRLPREGHVQINLPIGEIELFHPLEINRSNTIIKGQGIRRTVLQARFSRTVAEAVLAIRPARSQDKLQNIQLNGFTLVQAQPKTAADSADGIILEKVMQASITNLNLENSGRHSLVLHQTQDVKIEYVAMKDSSEQ